MLDARLASGSQNSGHLEAVEVICGCIRHSVSAEKSSRNVSDIPLSHLVADTCPGASGTAISSFQIDRNANMADCPIGKEACTAYAGTDMAWSLRCCALNSKECIILEEWFLPVGWLETCDDTCTHLVGADPGTHSIA